MFKEMGIGKEKTRNYGHISVTTAGSVERLGSTKLWQYASHFCVREGLHSGVKHAPDVPCVMSEMCHSWGEKCALHDAKNAPCVMCEMCPSWCARCALQGRKMRHYEQSRNHAGHNKVLIARQKSHPAGLGRPYQGMWVIMRRSVR